MRVFPGEAIKKVGEARQGRGGSPEKFPCPARELCGMEYTWSCPDLRHGRGTCILPCQSFTGSASLRERETSRHIDSLHMQVKLSKKTKALFQRESQLWHFRNKSPQKPKRVLKRWKEPDWVLMEQWQHLLWPIRCTTQSRMNSFHLVKDTLRWGVVTISESRSKRHGGVKWAFAMDAAKALSDSSPSFTTHFRYPSFLMFSSVRLGGWLVRCLWSPLWLLCP